MPPDDRGRLTADVIEGECISTGDVCEYTMAKRIRCKEGEVEGTGNGFGGMWYVLIIA